MRRDKINTLLMKQDFIAENGERLAHTQKKGRIKKIF